MRCIAAAAFLVLREDSGRLETPQGKARGGSSTAPRKAQPNAEISSGLETEA
ncbi:hypothetical protein JOC95_000777 [Bacillus tianshenii]|uniref:Uncharacterized protein n=1 Tax=Sutcliffiella tianshenii TaxID=1463404 RepID=A0ABS2NWX2_9BACI|nr:hypothetical protein [Bacillus tianshenii]